MKVTDVVTMDTLLLAPYVFSHLELFTMYQHVNTHHQSMKAIIFLYYLHIGDGLMVVIY